jgi:hypothetical protein
MTYPQKREERLSNLVRIRLMLAQISFSLQIYQRSFFILQTAVQYLFAYADENRLVENGAEIEIDKIDALVVAAEDIQGGGGKKDGKGA